jgi:hypothetical protein
MSTVDGSHYPEAAAWLRGLTCALLPGPSCRAAGEALRRISKLQQGPQGLVHGGGVTEGLGYVRIKHDDVGTLVKQSSVVLASDSL